MPPLFLQFSNVKKYLETISVHSQIFLRTKWSGLTSYTTYDLLKVPGAETLVPVLHFLTPSHVYRIYIHRGKETYYLDPSLKEV